MPFEPAAAGVDGDSPVVFSGRFDVPRSDATYRLGLLGATLAVVALPALYAGLVAAFSWVVWWHVRTNTWLSSWGTMAAIWLYVAPTIAGLFGVVSLVKPMIPRFARAPTPLLLDPAAEPGFFRLLEQVCRLVGAPMPREVRVDCAINASASFRNDRLGWLRPGFVLTLGMPLVAGLSVRELSGVLAHELGHGRQGGGLRLVAIIRHIDAWFLRIVSGRDRWHQSLNEGFADGAPFGLQVVGILSSGAVWVSRTTLTGLMFTGRAVSGYALRQMEFAADRFQAHVVGAETAVQTLARLRALAVYAQLAEPELRDGLEKRIVPVNLPNYLTERMDRASAAERTAASEVSEVPVTRFDSHPSDAARVQALQASGLSGVMVGGHTPARTVFRDFDDVCRRATRWHYERLGLDLGAVTVVQNQQVAEAPAQARIEHQATVDVFDRFFGQCLSIYRPVRVGVREGDTEAAGRAARATMSETGARVAQQYREYEWLESRRQEAFVAAELQRVGYDTLADFGEKAIEDAEATRAWAVQSQLQLEPHLDAFERAVGLRLAVACDSSECRARFDEFNVVADAMSHLRDVIRLDRATHALMARSPVQPPTMGTRRRLEAIEQEVADRYAAIRDVLGRSPRQPGGATMLERCGLGPGANEPPIVVTRALSKLYADLLRPIVEATLDAESKEDSARADASAPAANAPADPAGVGT